MIDTFQKLEETVISLGKRFRVAVACPHDDNTILALSKAVKNGFIEAILIGKPSEIRKACNSTGVDEKTFQIIESDNETGASEEAVRLSKTGAADIIMKGLVGSANFLKAIMDKEKGIMLPNAVLSYVGTLQIPAYHKLLFISDPAVIPFPDLEQKISMAGYAIEMARKFGIEKPKVALISATEKMSRHFESSADYAVMCEMTEHGEIPNCIMDGPLDLFLACDRKSLAIKGVESPVNGDADILLFPSLESSNPFYKALMLFAGGELAGLIRGTIKPVILMSRSDSGMSKYYCIALSCLMA